MIEVLVVVAIIALLLAILLPSLSEARRKAARLSCAAHLRTFGHALTLVKTERGHYPRRDPPPADPTMAISLDSIGNKIATTLVQSALGDPRAMYCPTSLQRDRCADPPYQPTRRGSRMVCYWKIGHISYIYLANVQCSYPDENGRPTFDPLLESPDRKPTPRVVLAGDRTVELTPGVRNVVGSNHGREGGWFFYTTGEIQWKQWSHLTPHPTSIYTWYWPRSTH